MLSESRLKPFTNRPRSHLYSASFVCNTLRVVWVIVVLLGELGLFYWSLVSCRWPSISGIHTPGKTIKPAHVLLITDTQVEVLPRSAYHGMMFSIRRALSELNLRKNWHVASHLHPDAVIFLGDMLANGKGARTYDEYERDVRKFKTIFDDGDTELHYVPGNEDVGLGYVGSFSNNVRSYYSKSFGSPNTNFVIANHTFIGLDAPGLVDEDYQRHAARVSFENWKPIPGGPVSFVTEVAKSSPSNVILLSHIPLSRSETADCGLHRERGRIQRTAGPGYQSMLGKHTTSFLLRNIQPLVVFSGDNHDYCDYTHSPPSAEQETFFPKPVREVTVKALSPSPHIKRPGFQLLSLVDPNHLSDTNASSFADHLCLLPDQHRIYTSMYLPLFLVSLLVLLFLHYRGRRSRPRRNIDTSLSPSLGSGRNSPALMVNVDPAQLSATWSPYSPAIPTSPRPSLPPYMRIPHSPSSSTTRLVASLPGTPAPSSPATFPVPMPYSGEDGGEDDDTMYPAQYATQRTSFNLRRREDDEWTQVRDEEDYDMVHGQNSSVPDLLFSSGEQDEFITSPSRTMRTSRSRKRDLTWSYTFTLAGRRRRLSLSLPSWTALHNLIDFFGFGASGSAGTRKRRRGAVSFSFSVLGVFWPAIVVWGIVNWSIL